MPSIQLIKSSDGTGNVPIIKVQSVRSPGATTIVVDTVENLNSTFMGSMGEPHTFIDPVTAEEITVISEATCVDFTGQVSGTNIEIVSIAPGFTDLGNKVGDIIIIKPTTEWANNIADTLAASHDNDGTLKAGAVDNAAVLASNVVETAKIKDKAVTLPKINGGSTAGVLTTDASGTVSAAGSYSEATLTGTITRNSNGSFTTQTLSGLVAGGVYIVFVEMTSTAVGSSNPTSGGRTSITLSSGGSSFIGMRTQTTAGNVYHDLSSMTSIKTTASGTSITVAATISGIQTSGDSNNVIRGIWAMRIG